MTEGSMKWLIVEDALRDRKGRVKKCKKGLDGLYCIYYLN
jgi:hypothetical protein